MAKTFKCVTWNVDMSTDRNRFSHLWKEVQEKDPDVIFFQEITRYSLALLSQVAHEYEIVASDMPSEYFTTLLIKKGIIIEGWSEFPYPKSTMQRSSFILGLVWNRRQIAIINSHLESTWKCAKERENQLREVFMQMDTLSEFGTVIFAGDTNLRDAEVDNVGGMPEGIVDLWEYFGKPEESKFTWDSERNRMKTATYKRKYQSRFDRVFICQGAEDKLVPKEMSLLGDKEIRAGLYPSDHLGIYFSLEDKDG